ncbi:hypothetical protein QVD17_26567 [Tagetes erecta]|uniref:Uncharacterized protein n=1 Tax=Tagetes erecta TaxID=13708 RepID=A0AAD8K6T4_TARER|nr:hypothetical protein QVD17_26567 [Tagetes erecta]
MVAFKGGGSGGEERRRGGREGARGRGWLLVVEIGEGEEVRQRGWGEEERETRSTRTIPSPARRRRERRGSEETRSTPCPLRGINSSDALGNFRRELEDGVKASLARERNCKDTEQKKYRPTLHCLYIIYTTADLREGEGEQPCP